MKAKIISFTLALVIMLLPLLTGCELPVSEDTIEYAVGGNNFTLELVSEEFADTDDTLVRLSILTKRSLTEYSVEASFTLSDGSVTTKKQDAQKERVNADSTFSLYVNMGEVKYSDITDVSVVCSGKSTEATDIFAGTHPRVTFMSDSKVWAKHSQKASEAVICPDTPTYENGFFTGWYSNAECTVPFDFASGVTTDAVVYAGRIEDIASLVNTVTSEIMNSVVTVHCTYVEDAIWRPSTATSTSSGVVIRTGDTTYVLTNCHSVMLLEGYKSMTISVEDCYGNTYNASIYSSGGVRAIDAEYDLACLTVSGMTEVDAIEMASVNPKANDTVISLGSPDGQQNAITVGKILHYGEIDLQTEDYLSNVTFPVIKHTAQLMQGSSGGALINTDFQLVGINYAGASAKEFSDGYSIPIEKIHEFLEKYL